MAKRIGKRITARQKAARRKNIAIARAAKKKTSRGVVIHDTSPQNY